MPIAFRTSQTTKISLDIDAGEPEETRPAFIVRFLTAGEAIDVRAEIERAKSAPDDATAATILDTMLRNYIRGWVNMPAPYSESTGPMAVCSRWELFELAGKVVSGTTLGELDLKKSQWASQSSAVPSAPPAEKRDGA
jgi:hypothetical protein